MYRGLCLVCFFTIAVISAQKKESHFKVESSLHAATEAVLPFFLWVNQEDKVPKNGGGVVEVELFMPITTKQKGKLDYAYGLDVTYSDKYLNDHLQLNALYGELQWHKVNFLLGMKPKEEAVAGLSLSNGNFSLSKNARTLPGFSVSSEYIQPKFFPNWLMYRFDWSEQLFLDERVTDKARLHHKAVYFQSKINKKLLFIAGLNHYAQWAGNSLIYGEQPSRFSDYLKILISSKAGENARKSDQINAIGNHLGNHYLSLKYTQDKKTWQLYWSHPFEDSSGVMFQNHFDGLYGVSLDLNEKENSLLKKFLFEFVYTLDQSDFIRQDGFFNNSTYLSGWTNYGNIIGIPLILTEKFSYRNKEGELIQTELIKDEYMSNRLMAYHIAFMGQVKEVDYKTHVNYVEYHGTQNAYKIRPKVISFALETKWKEAKTQLPFQIELAVSADYGNFIKPNYGISLSLVKSGVFSLKRNK